ncbi:MAG: hypothetical protein WB992_04090 [Bryobacteraceae bacterium]
MHSSRLFSSFLAPDNAIGFGVTDFIELILLALLIALLQLRPRIEGLMRRVAQRTTLCFLIVAALPIALRLLLLPHHPVPTPAIYDEFGHLFVADTVRHFRLANPAHPLHQFFETFFVLQEPTYSSIYPLGQGLVLALGWVLFGLPWAGVALSVAAFCALCYWMLLGWTTRVWALTGALLAVIEFGPLNEWMNSYWGGAVSAVAGCLVFGTLPRLREHPRMRDAAILGAGLGVQLLTRPYESILLVLSVAAFFVLVILRERSAWRGLARAAPVALLAVLPAVALTLLQNKQVTGSWTTLPYFVSQYQYGVPTTLTVQPNPIPHAPLTREQELDYKAQRSFHGEGPETLSKFLLRLEYRVRFYRFFLLPPLYLAIGVFLFTTRKWMFLWIAIALALFALGSNLFPYLYPRYIAAVTCLFVLASVTGLRQLASFRIRDSPAGHYAAMLILFLCVAAFCLWYGAHLFETHALAAEIEAYETWDEVNHGNPERRIFVNRELEHFSGKQLVFVRYWPNHIFQDEWVYNAADIDAAQIVWARDLGAVENENLERYYPDRTVWLLEPDARPPKLSRYGAEQAPQFLDVK